MIKSHKNRHQRDILRSPLSRLTLPVWGNSSFPSQKPDMMAVASFGSSPLLIHQRFSCVWYSECRWSYPQQWSHRQAGENNDKYSQHFSFVFHHNCPLLRVDQFEIPNAEFYELLSNWTWCNELKKRKKQKKKTTKETSYSQTQTEDWSSIVEVVDHFVVCRVVNLYMSEIQRLGRCVKIPSVHLVS